MLDLYPEFIVKITISVNGLNIPIVNYISNRTCR